MKKVLQTINEYIEKLKVLIIFHKVDTDGYTSAAIAKMIYPDADLLGWNYKDSLPNVDDYDLIILVDVTLNENGDYTWMHENKHKMIWIDHHFAAIEAVNDDDIPGIHPRRKDVKKEDDFGACVLTWKHFFGEKPVPKHILYCGLYDCFNKTGKYADWDTVWNYMLAMDKIFKWELSPEEKVLEAERLILEDDRVIEKIATNASVLEEARALKEAKLFEERSTEFVFNGVKAYLLNTVGIKSPGRPAAIMRSKMDHENCIVFQICYQQPNGKYKVSIRVSETCDLDANEIAKSFDEGGGGHEKAAGCDMTEEDINNLSNKSVFIPMWEHNSWFPTTFFTLEEAKENARTWEYPCDDLGNWDEDEIEIFEMILTKPLPKNRMLRNIDLPEYGKIINKHYIF